MEHRLYSRGAHLLMMVFVMGLGFAGQGPWVATVVLPQPAVHAFWYVRPSAPHTSEPLVGQLQSLGPAVPDGHG